MTKLQIDLRRKMIDSVIPVIQKIKELDGKEFYRFDYDKGAHIVSAILDTVRVLPKKD